MDISDINFFGETTFRNQQKKFGIKTDDRRRHVYVIGKTGMGKTALLENMAIQDIQSGKGVAFIDPHGEAAENLLNFIPSERVNDVVYFNPSDLDFPIGFNIMERIDADQRHLITSGLMGVFKKIWPDVWSARMEYILSNSILALLEYPGSTLLSVNRMLSDPDFRKKVVDKVSDPIVKSFWTKEFSRYTQRYETEATAAVQNKVGQFISNPLMRNIIGQTQSSINMRRIMDDGKILILNLSKGKIGEDNSLLLGALLITKLQLAAMSRVDTPEAKRKDFFLYVDEFQNFATEAFVNILSEARKYRLSLILGHQYIAQMDETVRDAVFGNVGTLVTFRVGAEDADYLEKEFSPEIFATDFVNLAKYNVYLKLMIDGISSRPFSAQTLIPFKTPKDSNKEKIIKVSRERYGTPKANIEEKIISWIEEIKETPTIKKEQQSTNSSTVLYDAQCSLCGKWTKVVFPPDGTRPVYCKPCLKKTREAKEVKEAQERQSAREVKKEPIIASLKDNCQNSVPFSLSKKEVPLEKKKIERKQVNLSELKSILQESLKNLKK
ncbi:MAG: CxxC-x17-CxxC domain-containing protein [Patescibacteria group bacterium]|nr:type IV secretion system DNA-binding domain-containing protein [Patescibacteria group bacterium]MBU1877051.1 type IV secretion system DNA-binding domain-containing protein [Patescibacteria group bacterium]